MYIGKNSFYCKSVRKSINIDLQGKTKKLQIRTKISQLTQAQSAIIHFMKPTNKQTVQTHKTTTEQTLSAAKRK